MITKKTNIETHAWLTATMRNGRKRIETLGWKRLAKLYYAARPGSPIRNRQTHERWMSGTTVVRTFVQDFDVLSVLTEVTEYDGDVGASVLSTQTFTPDPLGRITYSSVSGDGMPTVTLTRTHDANGNLTEVLDNYNGLMTHEYDFINRRVSTTHTEAGAGAAVADKRAEFWYFANGRLETIERFNDAAGDPSALLATTTYAYNYDNTLKTIVHSDLAAGNLSYGYTYGPDGDMTQMVTPDDTIDYTLDLRGQVTDVEYDGVELEDYAYDDNGNRTTANGAAYATETGNRMTTDGTYRYEYDDNGNRTLRYVDTDSSGTLNTGDTDITTYAWDYRNRLVTASDQATFGAAVAASVEYIYDAFNNRISKIVDADGDGTAESPVRTNFALLDGEVYLEFNGTTLTHRYMPGPSIDMNLAIEDVSTAAVLWALTDHQGTVRDVIDSSGVVQNHIKYTAFGAIESQTVPTVNYRFTYTGRELDAETGLYYYRARYYDAENGRFISEDPIAFEAGDANLYRYVGNNPGNGTDPMGLDDIRELREGSNSIIWMREVWFGYDWRWESLGWRDKNGVVKFYDKGLTPMHYSTLIEGPWGSYDSFKEVVGALKKDQKAARKSMATLRKLNGWVVDLDSVIATLKKKQGTPAMDDAYSKLQVVRKSLNQFVVDLQKKMYEGASTDIKETVVSTIKAATAKYGDTKKLLKRLNWLKENSTLMNVKNAEDFVKKLGVPEVPTERIEELLVFNRDSFENLGKMVGHVNTAIKVVTILVLCYL